MSKITLLILIGVFGFTTYSYNVVTRDRTFSLSEELTETKAHLKLQEANAKHNQDLLKEYYNLAVTAAPERSLELHILYKELVGE